MLHAEIWVSTTQLCYIYRWFVPTIWLCYVRRCQSQYNLEMLSAKIRFLTMQQLMLHVEFKTAKSSSVMQEHLGSTNLAMFRAEILAMLCIGSWVLSTICTCNVRRCSIPTIYQCSVQRGSSLQSSRVTYGKEGSYNLAVLRTDIRVSSLYQCYVQKSRSLQSSSITYGDVSPCNLATCYVRRSGFFTFQQHVTYRDEGPYNLTTCYVQR